MSNVFPLLPKLTANRKFIDDFLAARAPCFAIGVIEERKQQLGLLALRPGEVISHDVMEPGFNFGHSLLGNDHYLVVHFAFEFYGFGTYNVLLNPSNPLVRAVLNTMIDSGEYFFLAIGPNHDVTAFRSEIGQDNLTGLKDNLARIRRLTTNDVQYQKAVRLFQKHPFPPGRLLNWVCRDDIGYLDLTTDRLEMTPAAPTAENVPPGEDSYHADQRRSLAELLDGKVNDLMRAGVGDDLVLLAHMAPEMPLFKRLMDISGKGRMNDLVNAYPGLYHLAKLLELIATGIQSGDIEVPE